MFDAAAYMKARRKQRRERLIELAGGKCIRCGTKHNLEFDHRDPTQKLFELSGCALDKPLNVIMRELAKCDLLCKDHHLEKTRENRDATRYRPAHKGYTHGTARSYLGQPCRCQLCCKARKEYRNGRLGYDEVVAS